MYVYKARLKALNASKMDRTFWDSLNISIHDSVQLLSKGRAEPMRGTRLSVRLIKSRHCVVCSMGSRLPQPAKWANCQGCILVILVRLPPVHGVLAVSLRVCHVTSDSPRVYPITTVFLQSLARFRTIFFDKTLSYIEFESLSRAFVIHFQSIALFLDYT